MSNSAIILPESPLIIKDAVAEIRYTLYFSIEVHTIDSLQFGQLSAAWNALQGPPNQNVTKFSSYIKYIYHFMKKCGWQQMFFLSNQIKQVIFLTKTNPYIIDPGENDGKPIQALRFCIGIYAMFLATLGKEFMNQPTTYLRTASIVHYRASSSRD